MAIVDCRSSLSRQISEPVKIPACSLVAWIVTTFWRCDLRRPVKLQTCRAVQEQVRLLAVSGRMVVVGLSRERMVLPLVLPLKCSAS
jgi:hypothetical protein